MPEASPRSEPYGGDPRAAAASPRAVALATAVLLSLYMGLALGYGDAVPLFEAPDEPAHLHYAAFVADTKRMPSAAALEVPGVGAEPPFVYAIAAPLLGGSGLDPGTTRAALRAVGLELYRGDASLPPSPGIRLAPQGARHFAGDGSLRGLRLLRATSLAFGLLAVMFSFAAVWRVGRDARLALLAAGIVAFNPQFLFASATFSTDTAAAAIGAGAMWIVLRALEEGGPSRNQYIAGAALLSLGCLTRVATLPGLVAAAATIVAIDRRPTRERRIDLAIATVVVLVLAGPYQLWALGQAGVHPGDAASAVFPGVPGSGQADSLLHYLVGIYPLATFETYWGRFGWLDLAPPSGVPLAFFTLGWSGLLGYCAGQVREANALLRDRALHAYLFAAVALTGLAHLGASLLIAPSDGRALFGVAPQIGLLIALGFGRLFGHGRRALPLTLAIVAALVAIDLYCLRGVLIPAYLH